MARNIYLGPGATVAARQAAYRLLFAVGWQKRPSTVLESRLAVGFCLLPMSSASLLLLLGEL